MTGLEMLKYLTGLPAETLEQEIAFEVTVATAPDRVVNGHVPVIKAEVVDSDRLLYPDCGLITPEQAMEHYNQIKREIAAGDYEMDEEELRQHTPFWCPKILSENQLLMRLQGIQGYSDQEGLEFERMVKENSEKEMQTEEPEVYDPAKSAEAVLTISYRGPMGQA